MRLICYLQKRWIEKQRKEKNRVGRRREELVNNWAIECQLEYNLIAELSLYIKCSLISDKEINKYINIYIK